MRFFRKVTSVCQNCINGNNKKGKWKKKRLRKNREKGDWNIFCDKKEKYYRWDKYKYCFDKGD